MRNVEKYFIYDFETTNFPTGVDCLRDENGEKLLNEDRTPKIGYTGVLDNLVGIHQLSGYIVVIEDKVPIVKEGFDYHIKPFEGALINDKSLEIAGVTKEDLEAYTPEGQVFQEFIDKLKKYVNPFDTRDKFIPVGYNNGSFDDKLMYWFFQRNKVSDGLGGYRTFGKGNFFYKGVSIDLIHIYSALAGPYRQFMPNFKLAAISEMFLPQDENTNFHDAAYDVKVTKDLFLEFFPLMQSFRQTHKETILKMLHKNQK